MEYFKQLDALRFYAAFQVIILHMHFSFSDDLLYQVLLGVQGVPLFFILSGFLITGILLERQDKKVSLGEDLRIFYIRRALRIFPVYYLTLLLVFIAVPSYRNDSFYDFLYISNIRYALLGHFTSSPVVHFWSLAVEEQFYLIWPFVILAVSNRMTLKLLLSIFFFVSAINIALYINGDHFFSSRTFACMVYLSAGGLLAYFHRHYRSSFVSLKKYFIPALILYVALISFEYFSGQVDGTLKFHFFLLFSVLLVARFVIGFEKGFMRSLAENRVVLYLGKISYGLYVYHLLAIFPLSVIKRAFNIEVFVNYDIEGLIKIILTIMIAALSWRFIEKPVNRYKDRFPYSKKSEQVAEFA